MKRNRILAVALVLCLIAIIGFGSLAYFTADDSVSNKFMTTTSNDPNNPNAALFALELYETDVTDPSKTTDVGNTYSDILPGEEVKKDPTVKNTGLYPQWVRLKITATKASEWNTACSAHGIDDLAKIFGEFNDKWDREEITPDTTNNTLTYVYYLNDVLKPGETSTIFKTVTIPAEFTVANMETLREFELNIVAEAIQSEHTGDTAQEAFENCWTE